MPEYVPKLACVVRVELTPEHRRRLGTMASEAQIPADDLASRLLADLIDDDWAVHEATRRACG